MVFGPENGADIFPETRRRNFGDKVLYAVDKKGQPSRYVVSKPVRAFPRMAGSFVREPINRYKYTDQKPHGTLKQKDPRPIGYVPQIVNTRGLPVGEILHMENSDRTLRWSGVLANQIHRWCRAGVFKLLGDKRREVAHGLNWRELGLAWLNFVIEPSKPR